MSWLYLRDLTIRLAKCESEGEVISLLKETGYWHNKECWRAFGGNENNFSIIGNQQGAPEAALVEKLINSVDAVLLKECLIRGIDPESDEAPQSIPGALQQFFGVKDGLISNLSVQERNEMSRSIILAATGERSKPNYVIVDSGEGQEPEKMHDTILSLSKSNKLRVPFVQGKFNMGGTGVFQFCGTHNIQLIITKRCPLICEGGKVNNNWGVTVIRRESPSEGRRSSMYTYLTTEAGRILNFPAEQLKIIPTPNGYDDFKYGMFVKLFDYDVPGLKTNIKFDLNYRLALLLPNLAHPIRLVECRDYEGVGAESTLSGLNIRLLDDKGENVERGFPCPLDFNIDGQKFKATIYVFKEGTNVRNYRRNDGVVFSVNGQAHACLNKTFFKRKTVGLSYLADSLLFIIDCSDIDDVAREDLFMNSRDRLRDGKLKTKIIKALEENLREHQGLKALQEKRRRKAIANRLSDEKPLVDVLNNILKKSPSLSTLFIPGKRLRNPFDLSPQGTKKVFKGKKHPSFFVLKNRPSKGIFTREVAINNKFKIQFITDVQNDYFCRELDPGKFVLKYRGMECCNYGLNLYNGFATLTASLPEGVKVGDILEFEFVVIDDCILKNFIEEFNVKVQPPQPKKGGGGGRGDRLPAGEKGEATQMGPAGISLPNIILLTKRDWPKYGLTKEDALIIRGDETYDFFVNMDNLFLHTEIKALKDDAEIELLKARFKYSIVLIGMGVLRYLDDKNKEEDENFSTEEYVRTVANMVAPVILPIIEGMGTLDEGSKH